MRQNKNEEEKMNIFETIKAAVPIKAAAELYGIKLRSGDMVRCPFHDDRTPSLKLNDDYFYCFGCGATGDVIDFVARLFDISNFDAAQKLAADFGITQNAVPPPVKPKRPNLAQFRRDELLCLSVLTEYQQLLEDWKVQYAPRTPDDTLDDRFVEACQMYDYITYLADFLSAADLEHRVKAVDMLMSDNKIEQLRARLERLKEGDAI